jgi:hypothetical protein
MTRQDRTRYVMTKQVNNRVRVKVEDNILKMLLSKGKGKGKGLG